eukprot:gnl/Hemi2/25390_TR8546_c0_g1_i1.p1 gnl/Hemi2/25390_TR8546_c0_g1~~gnl/Hemi2/25390_TR8546_c0_g1_i1.p1  ORF type:complete len:899 (+),score=233.75 gnl/Hemi2/25390_TR8546_c0_g1_i1:102-2798(+)
MRRYGGASWTALLVAAFCVSAALCDLTYTYHCQSSPPASIAPARNPSNAVLLAEQCLKWVSYTPYLVSWTATDETGALKHSSGDANAPVVHDFSALYGQAKLDLVFLPDQAEYCEAQLERIICGLAYPRCHVAPIEGNPSSEEVMVPMLLDNNLVSDYEHLCSPAVLPVSVKGENRISVPATPLQRTFAPRTNYAIIVSGARAIPEMPKSIQAYTIGESRHHVCLLHVQLPSLALEPENTQVVFKFCFPRIERSKRSHALQVLKSSGITLRSLDFSQLTANHILRVYKWLDGDEKHLVVEIAAERSKFWRVFVFGSRNVKTSKKKEYTFAGKEKSTFTIPNDVTLFRASKVEALDGFVQRLVDDNNGDAGSVAADLLVDPNKNVNINNNINNNRAVQSLYPGMMADVLAVHLKKNLRHVRDTAQMYQTLRARGFPPQNIMTFIDFSAWDEVSHALSFDAKYTTLGSNPLRGPNLVEGLEPDFAYKETTSDHFRAALHGQCRFDDEAQQSTYHLSKCFKPSFDDNVFIFYTDHGYAPKPGKDAMPADPEKGTEEVPAIPAEPGGLVMPSKLPHRKNLRFSHKELATWLLGSREEKEPPPDGKGSNGLRANVLVVINACYSGDFIRELEKALADAPYPEKFKGVLTSTDHTKSSSSRKTCASVPLCFKGGLSCSEPETSSFSHFFLTELLTRNIYDLDLAALYGHLIARHARRTELADIYLRSAKKAKYVPKTATDPQMFPTDPTLARGIRLADFVAFPTHSPTAERLQRQRMFQACRSKVKPPKATPELATLAPEIPVVAPTINPLLDPSSPDREVPAAIQRHIQSQDELEIEDPEVVAPEPTPYDPTPALPLWHPCAGLAGPDKFRCLYALHAKDSLFTCSPFKDGFFARRKRRPHHP